MSIGISFSVHCARRSATLEFPRRIRRMTDLLRKAFVEVFGIPEQEQDALADLIFAAIKSKELDRDPEKYPRLPREFQDDARSGLPPDRASRLSFAFPV
jgi:hypothetical protein